MTATHARLFLSGVLVLLFATPALSASVPQEAEWNPYLAYKNLEIGEFYLKKGNYDAAISRFREALRHKQDFARAHLRLGQAYEKKKDYRQALEHYERYVELVPDADDVAEIRKKIAKLTELETRRSARGKSKNP